MLNLINQICSDIQFTCEMEQNNCLPFLDLLLIRNNKGMIELNIHRKPTHTQRFISADSNHHPAHKFAAFDAMIHRLCVLPLSKTHYDCELKFMYDTAIKNGFCHNSIDVI